MSAKQYAIAVASPMVAISWGEVADKISILRLKKSRLKDVSSVRNVKKELESLEMVWKSRFDETYLNDYEIDDDLLGVTVKELYQANARLWDIEVEIRQHESNQCFDEEFIQLARAVYIMNDKRSSIKREINRLMCSPIVEEKCYTASGIK